MKTGSATIIKNQTDDGLFVMPPDTPLKVGQTVDVDVSTRRVENWRSNVDQREYRVEMIDLVQRDADGQPIPFPVEMLLM